MTTPSTTDPAVPADAVPPPKSQVGRVLVIVAVLGMVAMWSYVVYLALGPGRAEPPDRLADRTFPVAAQARCDTVESQVARLPSAADFEDASDRADVLTQANTLFAGMLDQLERIAPAGDDGEIVREWLADWRTYLADREAYAVTLHADPDARLLVSPKQGNQVTEYIDAFAADNDMPACSTPGDVV